MQTVVQEILNAGKYTEYDICKQVGVSKETIRRIKKRPGTHPKIFQNCW